MGTSYSEDHPDRKAPETVTATPVEGESSAVEAKVVSPAKKAEPKTSPAKVTTKNED